MRLRLHSVAEAPDWPDPQDAEERGLVEFTLTYRGRLLSQNAERKRVSENKREIRLALSPQLQMLWKTQPQLRVSEITTARMEKGKVIRDKVWMTHYDVVIGGREYRPLIASDLLAYLSITWLRLDSVDAGPIVSGRDGADIDNRLKTLFDALQLPQENQITEVESGEKVYCLVEDDAMIHDLQVSTGPLLAPTPGIENPVELHLRVIVKRRGSSSFTPVVYEHV